MGAITPCVGREFDCFLYASIGEDRNGMPFTVLSAFSRMDVDPWKEAARLTQLPPDGAVKQLTSLLDALKQGSVANLDPARIAVSLAALLPRPFGPPPVRSDVQNAPAKSPAIGLTLLYLSSYVIFILLSNWLMGNLHTPGQVQPVVSAAAAIGEPSSPTAREAGATLDESK